MSSTPLRVFTLFGLLWLAGCATTQPEICAVEDTAEVKTQLSKTSLVQRAPVGSRLSWSTLQSQGLKFTNNAELTDIWERTRRSMVLPASVDRPRVQREIRWMAKNDAYLNRLAARAALYYHYILHRVIERGLPAELALLPAIESAYDPKAKSSAGALGLWQFMPATAAQYGLKDNWWFDGRRDVLTSTDAALSYLEYLHDYFDGDWLLALAAYNAGEGRVGRAIEKNRSQGLATDFWSLDLPDETRIYVPRLLALSELIRQPQKYDLALAPLADTPYFEVVDLGTQIELAQASELSGIEIEELYDLNAGYRRWATDPDGPYTLLLPVASAQQFRLSLASAERGELVTWRRHTVAKGETISILARKFDSNIRSIQRSNNLQSTRLSVGQILMIPTELQEKSQLAIAPAELADQGQADVPLETVQLTPYLLEPGESLWSVARRFNVTTDELVEWNGLSAIGSFAQGDEILVGMSVTPSLSSPEDTNIGETMLTHRVAKGENLYRISLKYGVMLDSLLKWNGLTQSSVILPGQELRVYP